MTISRRDFLGSITFPAAAPAAKTNAIGFGFGTYGMRTLPADAALRTLALIGYDGVELSLLPGWPTEPAVLSKTGRKLLSSLLSDLGLALPSLLEALHLTGSPAKRAENMARLNRAFELAHDLCPRRPPLVETVLGRKPAEWDQVKAAMAEELRSWAETAGKAGCVVCFKPHAGHAVNSAERALWLIREVGSANLRVVYDYSHMYLEGLPLAGTLRQLLPFAPFIHLKDAVGGPQKHQYLLPGEGGTDYTEYFRLLKEMNYRGFVVVEVSAAIHRLPGYDPVATARLCYDRLAPAFERAGVSRPKRVSRRPA